MWLCFAIIFKVFSIQTHFWWGLHLFTGVFYCTNGIDSTENSQIYMVHGIDIIKCEAHANHRLGNRFRGKIMGNYIKMKALYLRNFNNKNVNTSGLHELARLAQHLHIARKWLNLVALLTTGICNMVVTQSTCFPNVFHRSVYHIWLKWKTCDWWWWRFIEFNRCIICVVTLQFKYIFSKNFGQSNLMAFYWQNFSAICKFDCWLWWR